jgi:hypothetical protein
MDGMWTSDRRLCLTRDGKVVEDGDPESFELLVGEGGVLPLDRAQNLGLVQPAEAPKPEAKTEDKPADADAADDAEVARRAEAPKSDAKPAPAAAPAKGK